MSRNAQSKCKRALKKAKKNRISGSYKKRKNTCKVIIFKDGSVGAEINGHFRQWKSMSTSAKQYCQSALAEAKRRK